MDQQLHQHWFSLIAPLFPENAELLSSSASNDFKVFASWLLNNDPQQPDKRSRIIEVEVPPEAIEQYQAKTSQRKASDDQKFVLQVQKFLSGFNPEHDSKPGERAPEVKMLICKSVLDS